MKSNREEKLVIFVIDTSYSMDGTVIGMINSIMEELLSESADRKETIKVAIMEFNEEATWIIENPENPQDIYSWKRVKTSSCSNFGKACEKLTERFRKADCNSVDDVYVILFSDGMATDHYEDKLAVLKTVPAFSNSNRFALNFNEIYDEKVLGDFTDDMSLIYHVKKGGLSAAQERIRSFYNR